ncbi:sigma-w pathway protein ysdB [Virgibacillus byunsanensis]|uniref:Sigma-w pathway protein ysdB n=1 Tax=Virgibacillus byunsanensis TaxID=570945 RepID=A0ABW3LNB1_9BACI
MIVILFRVLILIAITLLVYTVFEYYRNPQRRLRIAKANQTFYFLDEANNSKKNLQLVYKGCLFEGEKYLGATEQSFEVVTIHIIAHDPLDLRGITKDDLYFIEKEILIRYPFAVIEWKHPIDQLVLPNNNN